MQPAVRPRTVLLPRRALLLFLAFLFAAFLTLPAVAEYLGPDRTTTVFVEVRDPDRDVWTLTHVDPFDGLADVCLIIHTCEEHPSVERQQALCGWVADNSGCDEAFKIEEKTVLLPEATIAGVLQNCSLVDGWCTSSPTLHLSAVEPVAGESISLIEGTRNGEPFSCSGVLCDVPLLEGSNTFTFWALSTWGDSSQMGTFSALVDSLGPTLSIPDSWYIWEPLAIGLDDGGIGIDRVKLTIEGANFGDRSFEWSLSNLPNDFIWDRRIGEVIAPIGEYPVTVQAWDLLGNSTSATGLILIPAPEEPEAPEDVSEPLSESASTEGLEPSATPPASGLSIEPTATSEPLAALVEAPAASIGSAEPATTSSSTEGGSGPLLWGAAALAAAVSATAYALNRRKARESEVEKMRKEAADSASPGAFAQRLSSLRTRAEAIVAPIRHGLIVAAVATQAALELARQRAEEARRQRTEQLRAEREERAEQAERRAALKPPRDVAGVTPEVDAWQRIELQRAQEYGGYSSPPGQDLLADPFTAVRFPRLPVVFEEKFGAGPFTLPSSPFASTTYRIDASASLRTLAEHLSPLVQLSSLKISIPWPPPLLGDWSLNLRDGTLTISHATAWLTPLSTGGDTGASAQLRWRASWGIGSYDGEFGIRSTTELQSRLLIGGNDVSHLSASIDGTTVFRPQNMLLYGAVALGVTALAFGIAPLTAALATAAGGLGLALSRLTVTLGH